MDFSLLERRGGDSPCFSDLSLSRPSLSRPSLFRFRPFFLNPALPLPAARHLIFFLRFFFSSKEKGGSNSHRYKNGTEKGKGKQKNKVKKRREKEEKRRGEPPPLPSFPPPLFFFFLSSSHSHRLLYSSATTASTGGSGCAPKTGFASPGQRPAIRSRSRWPCGVMRRPFLEPSALFSTMPIDSSCCRMWRTRPPAARACLSGAQPRDLSRPPYERRSAPTPRPWVFRFFVFFWGGRGVEEGEIFSFFAALVLLLLSKREDSSLLLSP